MNERERERRGKKQTVSISYFPSVSSSPFTSTDIPIYSVLWHFSATNIFNRFIIFIWNWLSSTLIQSHFSHLLQFICSMSLSYTPSIAPFFNLAVVFFLFRIWSHLELAIPFWLRYFSYNQFPMLNWVFVDDLFFFRCASSTLQFIYVILSFRCFFFSPKPNDIERNYSVHGSMAYMQYPFTNVFCVHRRY